MNQGLAILMERIGTHPEEFVTSAGAITGSSRWGGLVKVALDPARSGTFITPEERIALTAKLAVVQGEQFHKEVLRNLLGDQRVDDSSDQLDIDQYKRYLLSAMQLQKTADSQRLINTQLGKAGSLVQVRRPGLTY